MPQGRVILVGAGPGDPTLITLSAAEALSRADVVVFDRLAGSELLAHVAKTAELIDAGKLPGNHETTQTEINQLLIARAEAGKTVVRLKGGDPFVFGRGGEEALALLNAGIPFEVIPGVTSGVAVPAYAGIPVTHRGAASCVTFVTGHEDPAKKESDINWTALASTGGTLVFYMGVKQLSAIASKLIAAGLSKDTPAACIAQGTTPAQRSVRSSLGDIAKAARKAKIEAPAITVIGEVAGLPEELNWFESRPLFGRRIVNTRPVGQAAALTHELRALGAQVIQLPTIEVTPAARSAELDRVMHKLGHYHWILFTSAAAVDFFFAAMAEMGLDVRALQTALIACIGPATDEALATRGIRPNFVPAHFESEALLLELAGAHDLKGKRVLLPRSDIARKELPEGLQRLGAEVTEIEIYHTRTNASPPMDAVEAVRQGECDIITFTSSSTVESFVGIIGPEGVSLIGDSVKFVSIGPMTSATARTLGIRVALEAPVHTIPGLVQAIAERFGR